MRVDQLIENNDLVTCAVESGVDNGQKTEVMEKIECDWIVTREWSQIIMTNQDVWWYEWKPYYHMLYKCDFNFRKTIGISETWTFEFVKIWSLDGVKVGKENLGGLHVDHHQVQLSICKVLNMIIYPLQV